MPVQTNKSIIDLERERFDRLVLHDEVENTNLAAGANTLSLPAVPAGKLSRYHHVAYSYTGTVAGVRLEIQAGGKTVHKTNADPTTGKIETLEGVNIPVDAAEKLELVVSGATVTDDAKITAHGVQGID